MSLKVSKACHPEPHRRRGTSQTLWNHPNQKPAAFDMMIFVERVSGLE